ncbi:hypothetical protein ONS96_014947 [Cadophora gregata f. sp. sojae]|nr:hypothetical protein ONS96_014947 [Cadophora gregata f. sp. sojae]
MSEIKPSDCPAVRALADINWIRLSLRTEAFLKPGPLRRHYYTVSAVESHQSVRCQASSIPDSFPYVNTNIRTDSNISSSPLLITGTSIWESGKSIGFTSLEAIPPPLFSSFEVFHWLTLSPHPASWVEIVVDELRDENFWKDPMDAGGGSGGRNDVWSAGGRYAAKVVGFGGVVG